MEKIIKIIIADDSPNFLEGLSLILSRRENIEIIGTYKTGVELVNSQYIHHADLVLTDIEMPEMNGIEAARRINYLMPKTTMIAITMYLEKAYLETIIEAGFKGFIYKPNISKELFDVIEKVLKNEYVFPEYVFKK